jgi:putative ABC transport system permease protein
MGRTRLVCRLVLRDIRHRPAQLLLLLLVITAAMTVLTLGLVMHGVTSRPYDQTRAATAGPDVVVSSVGFPGPRTAPAAAGRLTALARARGSRPAAGRTRSPGPSCGRTASPRAPWRRAAAPRPPPWTSPG